MRIRHWLALLVSGPLVSGMLLTSGARTGWGQTPEEGFVDLSTMAPTPEAAVVPPPPSAYGPPYSTGVTPNNFGTAGYPMPATAWPTISPYEEMPHQFDYKQHRNDQGLWFRETEMGRRTYFLDVEILRTRFRDPDSTRVGAEGGPAFYPSSGLQANATGGGGTGTTGTVFTPSFDILANPLPLTTRDLGELNDHLIGPGVRGRWGYNNPDSSGFSAAAYHLGEEGAEFYLPSGFFNFPGDPTVLNNGIPITLQFNTSLPLKTGNADTPFTTIPFDEFYKLQYRSAAFGGNFDFYQIPFYRRNKFRIQTSLGARVMAINENFNFAAGYSGFPSTVTTPTPTLNALDLRPTAAVTFSDPAVSPQLSAEADSLLAGPEIGLQYALGGDRFQIMGASKFGLLANREEIGVSGRNFGIGPVQLFPNPSFPFDNIPFSIPQASPAFSTTKSYTHVSPMFEQTVLADMPLFQYVPLINKTKLFEDATFRLGYTFLLIGAVQRAGEVVDWYAAPINPQIRTERTYWFASSWSFGIHWNY